MARTTQHGVRTTGVNRNNSMLVTMNISQHSKSKKDKTATANTEDTFIVESGMTASTKKLFKPEDLKEIESKISEIRNFFRDNTLAWSNVGTSRLLPSKKYDVFTATLRQHISELDEIVTKKADVLDQLIANAQHSLGSLFDPTNYSTPQKFRDSFRVRFAVTPLPSADDFRVTDNISAEDIAELKRQIEEDTKEAFKAAMKDPWERLCGAVTELIESIKGGGKPQDRTFEGIIDLAEMLPDLNVGNDPHLDKMCKIVAERVNTIDPKLIRKGDKEEVEDAVETLEMIAKKMEGYMAF